MCRSVCRWAAGGTGEGEAGGGAGWAGWACLPGAGVCKVVLGGRVSLNTTPEGEQQHVLYQSGV